MRKNFLILMLMALLPLAGWAQSTKLSEVTITFANEDATTGAYTGTSAALPAYTVTAKVGSATDATELTVGTEFTAAWSTTEGSLTDYTPGSYTLTLTAGDGYEFASGATTTKNFTITNAAITVGTVPVLNDAIGDPITGYGVTYDGATHQVITTGAQASVTDGITGTMTISYAMNAAGSGAPATTSDLWVTSISDAKLTVTNAGSYDVYYMVQHNSEYVNNITATQIGTYTISQANATYTAAPTAITGLTYTAAAQTLVNAGTVELTDCKMQYSLDNSTWSDTPVKGTNAGDYTVYFRVYSDNSNYATYVPMTTDETPVQVTVPVSIAKRNLKVKPEAINTFFTDITTTNATTKITLTYDGLQGEDTSTGVFTGYTAPTASYNIATSGNTSTVTGLSGTFYNQGTYTNGLSVSGATSLTNYNVIYQKNNLTIYPAALSIELKAAPAAATFGTEAAAATSWNVLLSEASSKLDVKVQTGGTQDEPTFGTALTANWNQYLATTGSSANTKFTGMTISRANTSGAAGTYALTLDGATAKSSNFVIASQTVAAGVVFTINAASITITPANEWKVYGDADPAQLSYDVVQTGTTTAYTLNATQTEVVNAAISRAEGETVGDYAVTIAESVKTNAAFSGYTVTLESGWYTIEKRDLTITANPQTLYVTNTVAKLLQEEGVNWTIEGIQTINGVKDAYSSVALKFGDGSNDQNGTATGNVNVDADKKLNTAEVVAKGIAISLSDEEFAALKANYNITLNHGTLTVLNTATGIALSTTLDNVEAIAAAASVAGAKTVTVKGRTLTADQWNVMVLPFTISTYDFCAAIGDYAVFNTLKSAEGADVKFTLNMNDLEANVPFLVNPHTTVSADIQFNNVTVVAATPSKTVGSAEFIGTYAPINPLAVEDGMYTPQGGKFLPYTTESTYAFPATMAYLKVASASAARITVEEIDGSTTAISSINAEGVAVASEGWYNLNGVRLQGAPTEKGIYINNGKKIVIK